MATKNSKLTTNFGSLYTLKMTDTAYDYDLFVIGAGSGGVRAARVAAARGARVAVAEAGRLGGTCVNVGCVPKKLMVYAAGFADSFDDAIGFGWESTKPAFSWQALIAAKDLEITRLNGVYQRLLDGSGVEIVEGRAHLADAHTVVVGDRRFTTDAVLIATGGRPFVPEVPGADLGVVSDAVFSLPDLPPRVAIIGGGYIAVEFAGIMRGLGAEVSLIYRGPLFLRGFDNDIRATLAGEMAKRGISLCFNMEVDRLEPTTDGGIWTCGPTGDLVEADLVLWATGRVPNTGRLGLEQTGVEVKDNGTIVVDEYSQTSVPGIYAIGDCTDRMALTPVAIAEAMALVETLNGNPTAMDYDRIPSAVFSQPPIGTVGLTESEARSHCRKVTVYRSSFRPMKNTLAGRDEHTMMKLVVDGTTDEVLGVHMVGPDAGEIIQGFAVALKCGATKAQFDATVGIHPTAAEEFVTMREPVED
jgi:glutathione reductase (NADPH)